MSQVEDTQLNGASYKPGALVDNGRWRIEFDCDGQVEVLAERLWGAQTQRSSFTFPSVTTICRLRFTTPMDT